jgi:hypothetical protein
MKVRILRPAKTAMQSGYGKTKNWLLEFEPAARNFIDPLMGWNGQTDMARELFLWFDTQEEAIRYAQKHGLAYELEVPKERKVKPKSYAENFSFNRIESSESAEN